MMCDITLDLNSSSKYKINQKEKEK